jgi:probable DNA repair protein
MAVRWAADAWRLLADAELDPSMLRASRHESDFAAFLAWCADYRARLRAAGWLDTPGVRLALGALDLPREGRVSLLDLAEPSPVVAAVLRRLETRNWRIECRGVPVRAALCRRVALADADEELGCAIRWAAARLRAVPHSRVAVVLRNGAERRAAIDRAIAGIRNAAAESGDESAAGILVHGRTQNRPLVAAALNLLELVSGRGGFANLSGWLRGPLVRDEDAKSASAAASLELDLRGRLLAQVGFVDAYRGGGLRNVFLHRVPALAERLDGALAGLEGHRTACSPAQWAGRWQLALRALGWSEAVAELDPEALVRWEHGLEVFAGLTPMIGDLDFAGALDELAAILGAAPSGGAFPVHGIHVFGRIEDVGPGYDAAWVTGLTDTSLPEPARCNPLLPRTLQVAHDMPWSTPSDALGRGRLALEALGARVDELVLSWPASEYDFEASPSPLIASIEQVAAGQLPGLETTRVRAPSIELESIDDPAKPHRARTIKGGAHVLHLQARCPLRAFCQSRLAARAIEPVERGISVRHQGIVIHRALELLMTRRAGGETLSAEDVAAAVGKALDERFRGARRSLATLYSLEHERISGLIAQFVAAEALRLPHRPELLEQKRDIEVGEFHVRVRVDRMDRLDDGSVAILDYKTGRNVTRPGWFKDRLQDPQLPLYLLDSGHRATSLVIVAVASDAVRYLGIWPEPESFPGRPMPIPEGRTWDAQREIWRGQIETLVDEFGRGDVRLFIDDVDYAKGPYAPLSRFHEVLTLRYRENAT